eukprot:CAMPEP_0119483160 /NCGR_PEP_ID=MMETSP1344-20130328/10690_1 /TAXON_ID=236787 /ORGANISM="Florenciella parvula, Strain CCMP2471" /LENGTH=538 /DNA_ID=CAMNT_0007517629 /DNA_START=73 /DNA_END=1689 /DNA_ORIENTATION=+
MKRVLMVLALGRWAESAPDADAVPHLPDYGVPPSPMWSGYLDASAAEDGTKLHYWYSQMENTTTTAGAGSPVVLWLNGGPGSSSILGMLQEMGPVLINATGGLMQNPYAWTKQANLLILESPAGVGYSYCAAMATGGDCHNTDISTAAAARAALQDFFGSKFPELATSPLYITGESYAGVYVPTLADELLRNAPEVALKGVAVGDPCTDTPAQEQSMDMLWYAHKHGFVPDADYELLSSDDCDYTARKPFIARGKWVRGEGNKWEEPAVTATAARKSDECTLAERKFLLTTSKGISQGWDGAYINELDLMADAAALDWTLPDTLNYYNAEYMNRDDVKEALHVEAAPVGAWPGPPSGWTYTSNWNACNDAPGVDSMVQFYQTIAPQLDTTIVFNGDVDPCVSYEGTRTAIEEVGFPEVEGGSYRPWFFDKVAASVELLQEKPTLFAPDVALRDAGAQFGGHVVSYAHNLHFATVHGAGHMVPQFRPMAGARLLSQLLANASYPFAPPLPSDDDLLSMSAKDFDATIDSWTDTAKALVE